MSLRTLPLLFLNLGGEMMYVLDQRLSAQSVPAAKSAKVLDDIAGTMFNRKFLEEIFLKHQPLHSRRVLRAMFDKLANASIMRLSANSMDKLYDLMVMAVKHQVLMTRNPHDLVGVTLNHLDAIHDYASSEAVKSNVYFAYELLVQSYCTLTTVQMQSIRFALLNFLQDYTVRVSVFLQEGKQHEDGSFKFAPVRKLQRGMERPGRIRFFDSHGEVIHQTEFHPGLPPGLNFENPGPTGGLGPEETGNRGTKYGLNMYANSSVVAATMPVPGKERDPSPEMGVGECQDSRPDQPPMVGMPDSRDQHLAKQELDLLAKLIGGQGQTKETFRLSIFEEKLGAAPKKSRSSTSREDEMEGATMNIDLKTGQRSKGDEITGIIGEMQNMISKDNEEEEEDMLSLMDKAQL